MDRLVTLRRIHDAGDVGWYWYLMKAELRARGHLAGSSLRRRLGRPARYADTVADAIGDRSNPTAVVQSLGGFTAPLVYDRVAVNCSFWSRP